MSSVFLCLLVALLLCVVHCEEINSEVNNSTSLKKNFIYYSIQFHYILGQTPPPPLTGNLGGTKADKVALFEKYLNAGKPEQKAAYRDDNPILRPIHIHFNKTVQTQINGYAIHRVMLTSSDENCDRKAAESADAIMQKAFDDTVECLMQFRNRVRAEVNPDITDITEV